MANDPKPCDSNPFWMKYEAAKNKVTEIESKIAKLQASPNNVSNETLPQQTFNTPNKRNQNAEDQSTDEDSIVIGE